MPVYQLGQQKPHFADGVFVAPDANIIGDVVLHEGASIWFGATLRGDIETISVGKNSNIQDGSVMHTAKALITEGKEFPDGVLLMGSPAKVAREVTPEEIEMMAASAERYAKRGQRYLEELTKL